MSQKPILSFNQIWNLNFGFLGLQIAFTLLMANTSRILSALGANTGELSLLWLAPPIAGLLIQPIIGYLSDRKWTRFGRRIPYIFFGAIISTVLMFAMPNTEHISPILSPVLGGVCILFLLQGAFNISMQPFRSLVGDLVNKQQQNLGFSVQTFISNIGGLAGALLPFTLTYIGLSNESIGDEKIAATVTWSFYIGAVLLLITVLWTCFSVKEYAPEQYKDSDEDNVSLKAMNTSDNRVKNTIFRLSFVQFFSWFGIFFLWVYATDGLAENVWNTHDPLSEEYNEAGNWFGVLSGAYSIVTVVCSIFLAKLANKFGRKRVYAFSLILGALGLVSIYFITNQYLLLLPMIGIGIGWASILTFPFAIIAATAPPRKMGLHMGLLNITITVPQIAGGLLGGVLFKYVVNSNSIAMMLISGASLLIAALCVTLIKETKYEG